MKVLVTGATGFLGGWVTRALLARGHSVLAFVRNADRLGRLDVARAIGDILSLESLEAAVSGVDAIVHCAASVSLKPRDRATQHLANVLGTKNLLEAAAKRGVRVLHTSSIAAVGPSRERRVLDENAPRKTLDFAYPYADSKRESEDIALSFARDGHDVVVLNPGIMLGPGDVYFSSTEFVMRYLRSELGVHLAGGGSFCDVRDVAAAYPVALERGRSGERYILAGVNRRYGEVLHELRQLTGLQRSSELPRGLAEWGARFSEMASRFGEHPFEKYNVAVARWGSLFNFCSVAKAERELGYRTRDFSATLIDTVVDHLERGKAHPRTPELRALLDATKPSPKGGMPTQERQRTQRASSRTKRLSRDSGKRRKSASHS